jgi:hypothetical protein
VKPKAILAEWVIVGVLIVVLSYVLFGLARIGSAAERPDPRNPPQETWTRTSAGTDTQTLFLGENLTEPANVQAWPPGTVSVACVSAQVREHFRCTVLVDKTAQVARVLHTQNEPVSLVGESLFFYPVIYGSSKP